LLKYYDEQRNNNETEDLYITFIFFII